MPPPSLIDDNIERFVDDDLAATELRVLTFRLRLACRAPRRVDDSRRCGDKEARIGGAEAFGIV
jgi:hypothetical protein